MITGLRFRKKYIILGTQHKKQMAQIFQLFFVFGTNVAVFSRFHLKAASVTFIEKGTLSPGFDTLKILIFLLHHLEEEIGNTAQNEQCARLFCYTFPYFYAIHCPTKGEPPWL